MLRMPLSKLIRLIVIVSPASVLLACNSLPTVTGCSELAKSVLMTPTPHAAIQNSGDAALDWQLYGTAETGQLNIANDRALTGYRIVSACEVRDAEVANRRPWWMFW